MIEIIPNWHPLIVHFPIALVIVAFVAFVCGALFKSISEELYITSKWSLWFAAFSSIITVTLGWVAYNSVEHDTLSHEAMTIHRNWGIPSALIVIISAVWAFKIRNFWGRKHKTISIFLLSVSAIMIAITGYLGGEAVYRHGIGVLRIPEKGKHDHEAGHHHTHSETKATKVSTHIQKKNKNHHHHDEGHHEH